MKRALLPLAIVLLILDAVLLWDGARVLREASRYTAPMAVPYARFANDAPVDGWYAVRGCRVDMRQAVVESRNNVPARVYAPVFDSARPGQKTTHVYAELTDGETIRTFLDIEETRRFHGEQALAQWYRAHASELVQTRDVSGLAHRGVATLRDLNRDFSPPADTSPDDLTILSDGWRPAPGRGRAELIAGVALLLAALAMGAAGLRTPR